MSGSERAGAEPRWTQRLGRWLPEGTPLVAVGVAVLGAASYVHLAIAGHSLSETEMANLSVLWSVVFSLGYGLFLPVEQELTRTVAARRARRHGVGPLWRRGNLAAYLLFAGLALISLVGSAGLARALFLGDRVLVLVTLGGLLGLAVASPQRGLAAGTARFGSYGGQLGLDGLFRMLLAAGLAAAGWHTAAAFGLVLTEAPVLATLAILRPMRGSAGPGPPAGWVEFGRGLGPLLVSALLAQVVLNASVVSVRVLAPERTAVAAALLSALILIRVPLFVFASLQASLLSGLASARATADPARFGRLLRRACVVVTGLAAIGAGVAIAVGPWLIRTLFAAQEVFGRWDFAIFAAGTWAYLLALVLGQAALALGHHRVQMAAWIAGVATLVLITVGPGELTRRVEWAYALGNAVVAGVLAGLVVWVRPARTLA
ncbi:MAG TPA: polysaccharide biosynthesis protein [Micromonosporaceae bacterium]